VLNPPAAAAPQAQRARIVLQVAEGAEVKINDRPTKLTGLRRVFVSELVPGETYRFRIEVANGGQVARRDVILQAGDEQKFELEGAELAAR
jgi:uncharacterized protein (TIGR03000 family)